MQSREVSNGHIYEDIWSRENKTNSIKSWKKAGCKNHFKSYTASDNLAAMRCCVIYLPGVSIYRAKGRGGAAVYLSL